MIRDIIQIQKREIERKLEERYVERDIVVRGLDSDLIKVIIGPRRSGKSFFAIHALCGTSGFGYANFDDERLAGTRDYDEVVSAIDSVYGSPKNILFDEIQNLDRWELFANRLQRQGYNLVITGSNSKLLGRELATHLTGRHALINVFPFSFKEVLGLEREDLTERETMARCHSYVTDGGYPEPLVKNLDRKDYLSTLFNSIIYKDIVKRFGIRSAQGIEDLAIYLVSNVAREFSFNTLSKVTRCKSVHTVEKYLGHLEEAFVLFRVSRYSPKLREQMGSNKKIYCIDNGLVAAKAFKVSPEMGRLYENAVAVELKKRELMGALNVHFWRSGQQEEVDFVVRRGLEVRQLIQVCYALDEPKTKERETRALIKAGKELGCKNLLVITESYEAVEQATWFGNRARIRFVPLWKWLCEASRH